jgi:subtilisin family serine protease
MRGLKRVLAIGLTTLLFCTGSAMSQYWYYYMDGSHIPVQVFFCTGNSCIIQYPANLSTVRAVGATDRNDLVPPWSGQGWSLDVVAPGVDVWSFDLTGDLGIVPQYSTCISEFGVADPD